MFSVVPPDMCTYSKSDINLSEKDLSVACSTLGLRSPPRMHIHMRAYRQLGAAAAARIKGLKLT